MHTYHNFPFFYQFSCFIIHTKNAHSYIKIIFVWLIIKNAIKADKTKHVMIVVKHNSTFLWYFYKMFAACLDPFQFVCLSFILRPDLS